MNHLPSLVRPLALLALLAALVACGPAAQVETPTAPAAATVATATVQAAAPTAASAPTASAEPTAAPPSASLAPTVVPTVAPTPVDAPAPLAFYPCDAGFCSAPLDGGAAHPIFANAPPPAQLSSYAFSPDGALLAYAVDKPDSEGSATLYLLAADEAQPRTLFDVAGIESGNGGIEGYGVLGFADNGSALVFEDAAQVFVAALDGSNRRPVMAQRPYGASSTHTYYLAPDGSRVMAVGSGAPYFAEVAEVARDAVATYTLSTDRKPVAFGDDAGQIVVEQFDPPVDQVEGNPATKSYLTLAYELLALPASPGADETLAPGQLAYRDDGTASRGAASNVVAGLLILRDYERLENGEIVAAEPALSLLDLNAGTLTPITLPGYASEEGRRVWLVAT